MNTSTVGTIQRAPGELDASDANHVVRLFSSAERQFTENRLETHWTPVFFGVICLIGEIKRKHEAALRSLHLDECSNDACREEAQAIQDGLRHQHPLG